MEKIPRVKPVIIKCDNYNKQQFTTVMEYMHSNGDVGFRCITCKHDARAHGREGCCQPAYCGLPASAGA
jgi:hypothetical protein